MYARIFGPTFPRGASAIAALRSLQQEDKRKVALEASWKRRRANVAARLENAGLKLFLEMGIDAITVEDIAAAAKISRRSFYRYFDSPTDILCTVLSRSMEGWAQIVLSRPKTESMRAAFRAADAFAFGSPENAEPLTMALRIMSRSPDAWRRVTGPLQAQTANTYRRIIAERLKGAGKTTRSAGAIAAGLTAIMIHLAEESARKGSIITPDQLEQAMTDVQALLAPSTPCPAAKTPERARRTPRSEM